MRVCLVPLRTQPRNPAANWKHLSEVLSGISALRPDLVCLPECTLTGYLYEQDDLVRFAEPVPGPATERMAELARTHAVHLCFGLLEQGVTGVYDTAILLDPAGHLRLKHRKIEEKPPFQTGGVVASAETGLGRLAILICGDLFNHRVVGQLDPTLDLAIVPMSRSFAGRSPHPEVWANEERQAYLHAVKAAGVTSVLVNALEAGVDEPAFGGALVVSAVGHCLAEAPHGTDEVLIWDLLAAPPDPALAGADERIG